MEMRKYKKTGEDISLLGLGLMRLPVDGGDEKKISIEKAQAIVDACYNAGVNYFDTAYFYHGGESESFSKQALSRYPRESYHLATKLPMHLVETIEDAERIMAEQLQRTGAGYFDFYLLHGLGAEGFEKVKKLDIYAMLDKKRQQGLIRNLGFSFHDKPAVLENICSTYQFDFAQIQLNYLDWEHIEGNQMYAILEKHGIPCIVMEPVRGGRLANLGDEANALLEKAAPGKSIASWAIRWVASLPNVLCVLSGMSTLEQAQDNIANLSPLVPLNDVEKAALDEAVPLFKSKATIPCTGCRYCVPCPVGVAIPDVFDMYNQCAFNGNIGFDLKNKYESFPDEGKASHCIDCGQCAEKCPQHLEIPDLLRMVQATVDNA